MTRQCAQKSALKAETSKDKSFAWTGHEIMLGTLIHAPGCCHGRAPVDEGAGPASLVQPAEGPE